MNKNRLEAFSDGVFAIVITLLILDIKLPEADYDHLEESIHRMLPSVGAYVLSFFVIGLYWVFHHMYIDRLKKVNGTIIIFNFITLLLVSIMPFPTSLMGKYPFTLIPLLIYGGCLLASNLIGLITVVYLKHHPELLHHSRGTDYFKAQLPVYAWVNLPYIIALGIAFYNPIISYLVFVVVLLGVSIRTWYQLNQSQE